MSAEFALGEVCEICARQVDPTAPEFRDLPHISGENIESGCGRLLPVRSARDDGMMSGKYLFEAGDVLYSKLRPYLRKAVVAPFRGLCSADMYPLRVRPEFVDREWLVWVLLSEGFTRYASGQSSRARMPKLNRQQLLSWRLQVPPMSEQHQVVAALRVQLAAVERARAAAEERVAAAGSLDGSYLRRVFSGTEFESWPAALLGDVGEIASGITLGRKPTGPLARHVPYLRVANVKDGHLDLSEVLEIDVTEVEFDRLRLRQGDLLLTEGGDRDKLGRGTFWALELPECVHQNHIFRVRLDPARATPEFASAQIGSSYGKSYFLTHAKQTTGIATINQRVLRGFPLRLPSLAVQRRVVDELAECRANAGRLAANAEAELAAVGALPATLLRRAFSGAL